jgi:hypothetical protein
VSGTAVVQVAIAVDVALKRRVGVGRSVAMLTFSGRQRKVIVIMRVTSS